MMILMKVYTECDVLYRATEPRPNWYGRSLYDILYTYSSIAWLTITITMTKTMSHNENITAIQHKIGSKHRYGLRLYISWCGGGGCLFLENDGSIASCRTVSTRSTRCLMVLIICRQLIYCSKPTLRGLDSRNYTDKHVRPLRTTSIAPRKDKKRVRQIFKALSLLEIAT